MSQEGIVGDDNISWSVHWNSEVAPDRKDFEGDPREQFDYALEYLPKGPFNILEVGAGAGFWATLWTKLGGRYEGLDANPDGINRARQRHPELVFYQMKAQVMVFVQRYDVVFTHTCLQHTNLESKKQIIPRIKIALKPKGILLIEETINDGNNATTFTRDGWIKFIEPYGFKCVAYTPDGDDRNGMVFRSL